MLVTLLLMILLYLAAMLVIVQIIYLAVMKDTNVYCVVFGYVFTPALFVCCCLWVLQHQSAFDS